MASNIRLQLLNNFFVLHIFLIAFLALTFFHHGLQRVFHRNHNEVIALTRAKTCHTLGHRVRGTVAWGALEGVCFGFKVHYNFNALSDVVKHLK